MSTVNLQSRVAVVTGASAGIGEAIARELAAGGAKVVLNARRVERLEAIAAELNAGGGGARAAVAPGDAADDATIAAMLNTAKREFGREADLVVINAGRGLKGSVSDSDVSQWEELLRTNIMAAARLMRATAKRMLEDLARDADAGTAWTSRARDLVVIGSIVGRHVSPFSSMYGGTKFAVHGMTEGLRRELGPKGVRVSLVEPGFVTSEFQGVAGYDPVWYQGVVEKIGPVLTPSDVAKTVAFAASLPANVHVSDWIVRPTRQDYP
jgi:NADP-dependent 3-hydroxy acid dehydrogenase YdfG